jgi:hypothetical protein
LNFVLLHFANIFNNVLLFAFFHLAIVQIYLLLKELDVISPSTPFDFYLNCFRYDIWFAKFSLSDVCSAIDCHGVNSKELMKALQYEHIPLVFQAHEMIAQPNNITYLNEMGFTGWERAIQQGMGHLLPDLNVVSGQEILERMQADEMSMGPPPRRRITPEMVEKTIDDFSKSTGMTRAQVREAMIAEGMI